MQNKFLQDIFKDLDGYIELRIIGHKTKQEYFKSVGEFCDYSEQNLKDVYTSNIYFGVFSRSDKKGTGEYAKTTGAIWADYDNMSKAKALKNVRNAGIPDPSYIIRTGNGYHFYWLLQERATPGQVIPIVKAIAVKTGADPKVADKARILRLPETKNCKDLNNIKECKTEEVTGIRYDLQAFKWLESHQEEPTQTKVLAKTTGRACIDKIMQGVGSGNRNFALGRLVKHLQIVEGYTKQKAKNYIVEWNKRNTPPEETSKLLNDFNSYWNNEYNLLGCFIKEPKNATEQAFNLIIGQFCDKKKCFRKDMAFNTVLDNVAKYNNRVFTDYHRITGYELIIYGLLLMFPQGLTRNKLSKYKLNSMSDKRMNTAVDKLKGKRLIEVMELDRIKNKRSYFAVAKAQGTYGLGYTQISNGALLLATNRIITPAQFKVYALLLKYHYGKGTCYPSTITIARELQVTQPLIVKNLNALEKANFIERFYTVLSGEPRLTYRLLV